MTKRNRVQRGVSAGGQFAATQRADADASVQLTDPNPLVASGQAHRVYACETEEGDRLIAAGTIVTDVNRYIHGDGSERVTITDDQGQVHGYSSHSTLLVAAKPDDNQEREAEFEAFLAAPDRDKWRLAEAAALAALDRQDKGIISRAEGVELALDELSEDQQRVVMARAVEDARTNPANFGPAVLDEAYEACQAETSRRWAAQYAQSSTSRPMTADEISDVYRHDPAKKMTMLGHGPH